ncbi:MAG: amidase [Gammaproteobacteria bacterium]
MSDPYVHLDATAQAALVAQGEVTPLELIDAAIARVERLNPELNAIIHPLFDKARAQAGAADLPAGPLRGVPFVMKDLLGGPAGEPLHSGMRLFKRLGFNSPQDTYLTQRFRAAGLISIGRTNTPEWGLMGTTEPLAYGPTHNPWDVTRTPGGSSGGSAAAVAARLVAFGHGGDGGGSLRIPASMSGIFGLKPSRGRVSLGPALGECWDGMATEGVMTRSVRDMACLLDVMAGTMPGDPYAAPTPARSYSDELHQVPGRLRIGLMPSLPGNAAPLHAQCRSAVEATGRLLETLGHDVSIAHPAAYDEAWLEPWCRQIEADAAATAAQIEAMVGAPIGAEDIEPYAWRFVEDGRRILAADYLNIMTELQAWSRRMAAWWADDGFDLLVTPTLAEPPPLLGDMGGPSTDHQAKWQRNLAVLPYTPAMNATGQPAMSLPLHWTAEGLPVGVHFVPAYGREDLLIRVAAQVEQAAPWVDRLPPVCA